MPFTYDTAGFVSVRAVIGLDTNAKNLPDETLALDIYQGEAEAFINRNLSAAQLAAAPADAQIAATYYLASLVVPTLRIVEREHILGGQIFYSKSDLEAIAERLRNSAATRISDILEAHPDDSGSSGINLNFFTVAKRRRTV